MTLVPFPSYICGDLEMNICYWIDKNEETVRLNEINPYLIEFDDDELATYFRITFGL